MVRDVIQKTFNPPWTDKVFSRWGKLTTVVIGAVAVVLALQEVRVIFWFVLFAWAGAIAGMIAGFAGAVGWVLLFKDQFYDLYEMIPGFALGFAATIGVSLVTEPPPGVDEEFDSVWGAVGRPFGGGGGSRARSFFTPSVRGCLKRDAVAAHDSVRTVQLTSRLQQPHVVLQQHLVATHEGQSFLPGLCDEHPVERIPMVPGQVRDTPGMDEPEGEFLESGLCHGIRNAAGGFEPSQ